MTALLIVGAFALGVWIGLAVGVRAGANAALDRLRDAGWTLNEPKAKP